MNKWINAQSFVTKILAAPCLFVKYKTYGIKDFKGIPIVAVCFQYTFLSRSAMGDPATN
jgi:hypothetical protein